MMIRSIVATPRIRQTNKAISSVELKLTEWNGPRGASEKKGHVEQENDQEDDSIEVIRLLTHKTKSAVAHVGNRVAVRKAFFLRSRPPRVV
jgi:hypothetical protein